MVRTSVTHSATPRVPLFCSYHILTSSVVYYWTDARQHGIYLFYIITLIPKYFNITRKPAFCPAFAPPLQEKKPVDVIYDRFKMKQFHWLLCLAKNRDWSRKIAPLSNLTRASLLVKWKLTAKAELNCEIYKSWRKCWKNQVIFLSSEQPCEPKSLDVALKITGVEKIPSENLWLRST